MMTSDPIERNECQWRWYRDKHAILAAPRSLEKRRKSPTRRMFRPVIVGKDKVTRALNSFPVAAAIN